MSREIEILIAKYFDNNLSAEDTEILLTWINQSKEHKQTFKQLKEIWQATHPVFNPNDIDLAMAEKAVLKRIRKNSNNTYQNVMSWWQKVAAVLLIPMFLFSTYLWINNRKTSALQTTMQEVTALPGTRTKVNLPDGSIVWLNSGSTLTYPTFFANNERCTTLSGEGYFSVKTDKSHPFYVNVNNIRVMVTGTELNVEGYRGDSINSVILTNGSVNIITQDNKQIALKPNQCFSLNILTQKHTVYAMDAASYSTWKDGILAFRDDPLENVFKRIGRAFNVDIRINNPQLATQKYRATFEGESLQQILDLISLSAPIKYKRLKTTNNGITKEVIEVHPK